MPRRAVRVVLVAVLAVAFQAVVGRAQDTVWINPSLGDWHIDSNWSNGIPDGYPPDAYQQNALIPAGTALISEGAACANLVLGAGGSGSLIISAGNYGALNTGVYNSIIGLSTGTTSSVTVSGGSGWITNFLQIGSSYTAPNAGNGIVRIESDSYLQTKNAAIAQARNSTGSVTITGAYSSWSNAGSGYLNSLNVGLSGTGSLTVSAGATVRDYASAQIGVYSGSNGSVTVTGTNSLFHLDNNLQVGGPGTEADGQNGVGTLQISSSGLVEVSHIQVFDTGSAYVNNGSSTVSGLTVSGGANTVGVGSPLGALTVGNTSSARMVIQTGGTVSNSIGTIGANSGTTGSVLLQDANSTWTNSGDVVVGQAGTGTLEVRGGSKLYSLRGHVGFNSGSSGSVIVSDPGSSWTASGSHFIGNGGVGSLQVLNGGVASTAGNSYLGFSAGASGTATVSGAGSIWNTAATLAIGGNLAAAGGSGRLMIGNGGAVNAGAIRLYSTGQIELNNTTTLTGPITSLGGQIRVSSGDAVLSNDITLESGGLTVRTFGNNATFSGNLSGVGGLTKDGGGMGTLTLTGNNTYTGETIVDSGRLVVEGSLSSPLTLENGAVLDGSGTVGPVTIKSGGIVAPGNSPGLLTAGDTRFEGGGAYLLDLRSDGTGAAGTDWDSLAVNTLDISALSEANPFIVRLQTLDASNGLNFLDVWDRNVSHTWDSVLSAVALGGGDFDPRLIEVDATGFQNPISGTFSVVQDGTNLNLQYDANVAEPGDYNHDNIVDAADYVVWRKGLGTTYTQADYDVWRANFGQTAGSGSGAIANAAVPEPATLVILILAAAGIRLRCRHFA